VRHQESHVRLVLALAPVPHVLQGVFDGALLVTTTEASIETGVLALLFLVLLDGWVLILGDHLIYFLPTRV
jgi:hypothetical protein